mmetsp:Transcript_14948/g.49003  ORF Transcript_14948/g.49003 Transcript_14948/m.49003 type:complete len:231 (+) Transcript_14948:1477-2169(+)
MDLAVASSKDCCSCRSFQCKHLSRATKKSSVCSLDRLTVGMQYLLMRTTTASPLPSLERCFPSKLTHASERASEAQWSSTTLESGRMTGRNERVCGQMGVRSSAESEGWTMEPPAATEYAVDPVGVAMSTPSAAMVVMKRPRSHTLSLHRNGLGPRSTSTSFSTWNVPSSGPSSAPRRISHSRRMRSVMETCGPASMRRPDFISSGGKLVRNPIEPKWNDITIGTGPWKS